MALLTTALAAFMLVVVEDDNYDKHSGYGLGQLLLMKGSYSANKFNGYWCIPVEISRVSVSPVVLTVTFR